MGARQGATGQMAFGDTLHRVPEQLLFVAEPEVHGITHLSAPPRIVVQIGRARKAAGRESRIGAKGLRVE